MNTLTPIASPTLYVSTVWSLLRMSPHCEATDDARQRLQHLAQMRYRNMCWKRGMYAHTYTPVVIYFRSGRSGLALGVFILPPTSSFLRSSYLLDSSVKYIYMPLYPRVLVYQEGSSYSSASSLSSL